MIAIKWHEDAMNGNGENTDNGRRLTRLEEFVEVLANEHIQFAEEHKRLLTAQVVLTDRMDKLTDRMDKLTDRMDKLIQAQTHTEERMSVLIQMMDGWIKRQA
jgi:CII-binding regulator of phage lambda lysogenization HflD